MIKVAPQFFLCFLILIPSRFPHSNITMAPPCSTKNNKLDEMNSAHWKLVPQPFSMEAKIIHIFAMNDHHNALSNPFFYCFNFYRAFYGTRYSRQRSLGDIIKVPRQSACIQLDGSFDANNPSLWKSKG